MKNKYLLILLSLVFLIACKNDSGTTQMKHLTGKTMGTSYNIKLIDDNNLITKAAIDSILIKYNQSVSTYIPSSTISKFNQADSTIVADSFLLDTYYQGVLVSEKTNGAFDATVMPLVNYWGFGYDKQKHENIDSTAIDSIMQYVGYRLIDTKSGTLFKRKPKTQLDLSAVAKGFGVDILANYVKKQGVENFMVEIGGEVSTSGKKPNDKSWILGIDKPIEDLSQRALQAKIKLEDKAMATSGNYRNFSMIDGKKVAHTINPKTGYPEFNSLLSATVITDFCAKADAYATAFMVMGFEKTREFLINNSKENLEVFLIYANDKNELKTWKTHDIEIIE